MIKGKKNKTKQKKHLTSIFFFFAGKTLPPDNVHNPLNLATLTSHGS